MIARAGGRKTSYHSLLSRHPTKLRWKLSVTDVSSTAADAADTKALREQTMCVFDAVDEYVC